MFKIWIRLMAIAALLELGISAADFKDCHGRECILRLHVKSMQVLNVDWKPISVWPEEAKQFRSH